MQGRRKPYTVIGIKKCKCVRCSIPAHATWQICADNNIYRPLCINCDIELNEMVLKWIGFQDWEEKMKKYKEAKNDNL